MIKSIVAGIPVDTTEDTAQLRAVIRVFLVSQAVQGVMVEDPGLSHDAIAIRSIAIADKIIAALEKKKE